MEAIKPTENEYKLIELVTLLYDALRDSNARVPITDLDKIAVAFDRVIEIYKTEQATLS